MFNVGNERRQRAFISKFAVLIKKGNISMKTKHLLINIVLWATLLLASCSSDDVRVGELRTESQSVELGNAKPVDVNITIGAGALVVTGSAEKLLEADFTYNVAKLKPEVEFTDGTLVVQHPNVRGYRTLQDIKEFRNEWDLRLNNDVPMNLSLGMGAGTSDLQLADLSLTGLDVMLGAGESTLDLSGDWAHDLHASITTGASRVTLRLPKNVGVRVEIDSGASVVTTSGLKQDGNTYVNDAYGVSSFTLEIVMETGIGQINLEVKEEQTQEDPGAASISGWIWHDQCNSGKDGQPAPVTTPPGCVKEDSPLGLYHANGILATDEPLIEGVVVTLGKGACPSTGLAETTTIITDLSYMFTSLNAGKYCVSIDPQREPNFSILRPGEWAYPVVTQNVIGITVTVTPGEYKGMVNFGWDYQFRP
jgi:hypothetical protein